jgi:ParB family transcriptional regulator, chromosome partitioning protein
MKKRTTKKVKLSDIKPYWRNPRDNAHAVEKVKQSIEDYGYNSFICVDKNNIIVAGHTRYKALQELGIEEITVIVADDLSEQEVKEYRIIDNKTGEIAKWSDDLKVELREIEDLDVMSVYFDDMNIDLEVGNDFDFIGKEEIEEKKRELEGEFKDKLEEYNKSFDEIICPECGHEFQAQLNKISIKSDK